MNGQGMLDRVLPRLAKQDAGSGVSFIDALNTAVGVVASRLWEKRSELVKATMEIDADAEPFALPSNFLGLAEDPYAVSVAGQTSQLTPLPTGMRQGYHGKTGTPQHYRIFGKTMELFPAPNAAFVVWGEYFANPGTMSLSSQIPWSGMFDTVLADAVIRIAAIGDVSSVLADPGFREVMKKEIDAVLSSRTNPAPRRTSGSYF